ncbi:hypothetical protein [Nocardia pseudovaccinii]|uniref:hypothetical protein n=1 Tax=Nocardia pseudovaccinii TaxID=189540 RepID=UPI000B29B008|nr:hypothetical protein [Nocardia pseudovaccinii]
MQVDRPRDPLAVALGNASMLGTGYLLLRRHYLAITQPDSPASGEQAKPPMPCW